MQLRCLACDRMVETPPGWVGEDFNCPLCGRSVRAALGSGQDRADAAGPGGGGLETPAKDGAARGSPGRLVAGTVLCIVGLLMVLQSMHYAFTRCDFSSVHDVSGWAGALGIFLLVCAAGAYLIKRGAPRPDPAQPARRSPLLVPTVVILGVGGAYGLMLLGGVVVSRAWRPETPAASGGAVERFSGRGVTFDLPEGWLRMTPDKEKLLAWVISPGSDPRQPEAMIMVESGKTAMPELSASAANYAAMWKAKVLDEPTDLAGVPALRVRGDNPTPEMRPVEAVVAIRRGQIYLIMGGATAGHRCAKEVEAIRRSWKWRD